jgi:hypothetical protein
MRVRWVGWPSKNHLGCAGERVTLSLGRKKVAFLCVVCERKEGVAVCMAVHPVGPPSDPGRECSGWGSVGVAICIKACKGTELRGRNDATAQCSKCW